MQKPSILSATETDMISVFSDHLGSRLNAWPILDVFLVFLSLKVGKESLVKSVGRTRASMAMERVIQVACWCMRMRASRRACACACVLRGVRVHAW